MLIIGAAILIVTVVIIALSGIINQADDQNVSDDYNNQMSGLRGLIGLVKSPFEQEIDLFEFSKYTKIEEMLLKQSQN